VLAYHAVPAAVAGGDEVSHAAALEEGLGIGFGVDMPEKKSWKGLTQLA